FSIGRPNGIGVAVYLDCAITGHSPTVDSAMRRFQPAVRRHLLRQTWQVRQCGESHRRRLVLAGTPLVRPLVVVVGGKLFQPLQRFGQGGGEMPGKPLMLEGANTALDDRFEIGTAWWADHWLNPQAAQE